MSSLSALAISQGFLIDFGFDFLQTLSEATQTTKR